MQILVYLFSGIICIGKISARNESDFITILIMISGNDLPYLLVIRGSVMQGQPAKCPGNPCTREGSRNSISEFYHSFRRMQSPFIFTNILIAGGFDLINPDNGIERQKPIP